MLSNHSNPHPAVLPFPGNAEHAAHLRHGEPEVTEDAKDDPDADFDDENVGTKLGQRVADQASQLSTSPEPPPPPPPPPPN